MAISANGPARDANIEAYRGDTFERWIPIRRNGVEEVLHTSTFKSQIRNGATIVHELTTGAGIGIEQNNGNPAGVLILTIDAAKMATLPPGTYTYDMQQTYPDTKVRTRFRGSFTITDDVTKPAI